MHLKNSSILITSKMFAKQKKNSQTHQTLTHHDPKHTIWALRMLSIICCKPARRSAPNFFRSASSETTRSGFSTWPSSPAEDNWLVVSPPLKNISQLGWLFPKYGKIQFMFQTTNQLCKRLPDGNPQNATEFGWCLQSIGSRRIQRTPPAWSCYPNWAGLANMSTVD